MRTANRAFQLEARYPGMFLLQGWLGGILAGYIGMVCLCFLNDTADFLFAIGFLYIFIIPASILATVKATILWAAYRLTGIQLGAAGRVVATTICVSLLALFTAFQIPSVDHNYLAVWIAVPVLVSLPTALLVGSSFKPWELCTFGTVSVHGERVGSTSLFATLGTLPLRFLSLGALAVWILFIACKRQVETIPLETAAVLSVSLIYFVFSAYVTFRSPRKPILLIAGLVVNLLVVGLAAWAFLNYSSTFLPEMIVLIGVLCTTCVVFWILFLVARLSVPTNPMLIPDLNAAPLRAHDKRDHECLGSRFLQWHESEAI